MMQFHSHSRSAPVQFTGSRPQLLGILMSGYSLMVPTLGIYRFWLVTGKRRFYWSHTELEGDPLEYTGNAIQLLIGFLFAIGIFLPLYVVLIYLSLQDPSVSLFGYGGVGLLLWFLIGFAIYKARDFRLSRTLWRGIRFDQTGSAWNYALRRFGWSILVVATLGLAYPFMAGNLWRYRYRHTWYGDRQFGFSGSWRTVALPFYGVYFALALPLGGLIFYGWTAGAFRSPGSFGTAEGLVTLGLLGVGLIGWLGYFFYQGRELSGMLSSVRLGAASLDVRVRGRTLLGQTIVYNLVLSALLFALGIVLAGLAAIAVGLGWTDENGQIAFDLSILVQNAGFLSALMVVGGYLLFAATFSLVAELILGFGYWTAVARGIKVVNLDDLRTIRARPEDRSIAGEGLADALNVGAF